MSERFLENTDTDDREFNIAMTNRVDTIRVLLQHNASALQGDNHAMTPLFLACNNDASLEAARLLLDEQADVNHRSQGDLTALHVAASSGSSALVRLLLERGADTSIVASGRRPGTAAQVARTSEIRSLIRRFRVALNALIRAV